MRWMSRYGLKYTRGDDIELNGFKDADKAGSSVVVKVPPGIALVLD